MNAAPAQSSDDENDSRIRSLREIAAAYWRDSDYSPQGFVMIYGGEVCAWSLDPQPSEFVPGVAAVPASGPIRWTAGGTSDTAADWSEVYPGTPYLASGSADVTASINQLLSSERGTAAAVALRSLLSQGGTGLDSANWLALEILCRACRIRGGSVASKIRDALPASV